MDYQLEEYRRIELLKVLCENTESVDTIESYILSLEVHMFDEAMGVLDITGRYDVKQRFVYMGS